MYKYKLSNKLTLILSLLIIVMLTTGMQKPNNNFNGNIFKNIYIEQINVGKLKVDEAKDIIEKKYSTKTIHIKYNDKIWTINPDDINLDYNIDDAVKKAYSYTRSDSKFENIKRKCDLEINKPYNIKLVATYSEYKLSEIISTIQDQINKNVQQATIQIADSGQITTTQ